MTLDEIQLLWEKDSIVDQDNLHEESIKIPVLHSKYYKIYNNILLLKRIEENKYKELKKEKWEYFTGKADSKIYVEKPFDYKVLRQDIDKYIDADKDIIRILSKLDYFDVMLNYLDSILKTITNRSFQIKNAIDFMKFTAGYE
jgi:hypothetical protein